MKTIAFLAPLLTATIAHAHGEDKLGPHGGFIRMPGAFHTEVVATDATTLKVYLLDLHWKNPSTKDAAVEATIAGKKAKCEKSADAFTCKFQAPTDLSAKGKLELRTTREEQKGVAVEYDTPLSLKTPST